MNFGIIYGIGLPVVIFSIWLLYIKRQRSITLLTLLCLSVNLFIALPILIVVRMDYSFSEENWPTCYKFVIPMITLNYLMQEMLYTLRVFILYFHIGYTKAVSNKTWS
eukprot:102893_1